MLFFLVFESKEENGTDDGFTTHNITGMDDMKPLKHITKGGLFGFSLTFYRASIEICLKKWRIIAAFFVSFALQFWFPFKSDSFCRFFGLNEMRLWWDWIFSIKFYTADQFIDPMDLFSDCNSIDRSFDAHNITLSLPFSIFFIKNTLMEEKVEECEEHVIESKKEYMMTF